MNRKWLFFRKDICTGCQQCVMACSLSLTGLCGVNESHIQIATDPIIGLAQILLSDQCQFTSCHNDCARICSLDVIKVVIECDWEKFVYDNVWDPVPGISKRVIN